MEDKLKLTVKNFWRVYSSFVVILVSSIKIHIVSILSISLISLVIYLGPAGNKIDGIKILIVSWVIAAHFLLPLGVIMKFFPDGFKPEGKIRERLEKKGYL